MHRNLLLAVTITMVSATPTLAQIVPGKLAHESVTVYAAIGPQKTSTPATRTTENSPLATPDKEKASVVAHPVSAVVAAPDGNPEPTSPLTHKSSKHDINGGEQSADTDPGIVLNKEMLQTPEPAAGAASAPTLVNAAPSAMVEEKPTSTSVPGINTSGTVRVQGLENAEGLFNVMANGLIVLGIAWAGPSLMTAWFRVGASEQGAFKHVIHVLLGMLGLIAMPAIINWLVASGRDAGIFTGM